jgi:hypothetical protein
MRRQPGQVDQLFIEWGVTGATIGVRVDDLEGATTIGRTTGFVERPAGSGLYYLDPFTFPTVRGSYVLIYNDDGTTYDESHVASELLEITSSAGEPFDGETYAETEELFRILKIRTPTDEQEDAATRVLAAATFEIDNEIDLVDGEELAGAQVSLAQQVCLERAAELWKLQEVQFGVILGSDFATHISRDTWKKHSVTLGPLKQQWGFA